MKRFSLLVLSPRFPYPVIGGDRLRIYQVCKALSRRFDLTLLSLCETEDEMRMQVPEDGVFVRVERIYLSKGCSYLNALFALPSRMPMQVAYYRSRRFANAVKLLLPEHDGVLSHLIRCAEYVRHSSRPKILEMTDAISLNYERVRAQKDKSGFKSLIYSIESRRLKSYEQSMVQDFDVTVLVSDADKQYLVGDEQSRVLVCTNGVDIQHLPFHDRLDSRPVIAYIGNMSSVQNMDACIYFARDIMPLVNKRFDAVFRIVGKISEHDAARLRAYANVEVVGSVRDVAESLRDARIGVCPVRLAAGVQNKVLEYMAIGLPVVSSRIGHEGFAAVPGEDLLLADSPEEYVSQIERLWSNPELAAQLARNGRTYVEVHHDWSVRLQPMIDRVCNLVGQH